MITATGECDQCEALMINGVRCHEVGCPDAWMDYSIECKCCGFDFTPEDRDQILCSTDCAESYHG